ncbi:hypothetical protein D9M71_715870 [compost metagenome]
MFSGQLVMRHCTSTDVPNEAMPTQYNIGVMYDNGRAVPLSESQAYASLLVALANGGQDQSTAIPIRDMLAAKLSPDQLAEAQQQDALYFEQC